MKTIEQMVKETLVAGKFDGLFNEDLDCACGFNDLAPCGRMQFDCIAGVERPCDCGDHDFHIVPREEAQP